MDPKQQLISALQSVPLFQQLSQEHFEKVLEITTLVELDAKQELFREGDLEDFLYIVIQGRVAIEISVPSRGRIRIFTAEPMDEIGWSCITPVVRQRTAGARTVLPSCLAKIDAAKLRQICDEDCDFGYIIMRRMSNVIASRLLTTRLQLLDMFSHPGKEGAANG
jgi:CRP-like cAMP-binding protein